LNVIASSSLCTGGPLGPSGPDYGKPAALRQW
jgi:hypothetical protein